MRIHFVIVPVFDSADAERELNAFLASHRVVTVEREVVRTPSGAVWAVSVTYLDAAATDTALRKGTIDYREVLPPAQFQQFSRLRALRKKLAEQDGVPAYALFTNEQLAMIVKQSVRSIAALAAIPGVGKAKTDKYGKAFLDLMNSPVATDQTAAHQDGAS